VGNPDEYPGGFGSRGTPMFGRRKKRRLRFLKPPAAARCVTPAAREPSPERAKCNGLAVDAGHAWCALQGL
jgi:hypothetical protein